MRIIRTIKVGNKITTYVVETDTGQIEMSKDEVIALINVKRIENATIQMWKGKPIIRIKDKAKKADDDRVIKRPNNKGHQNKNIFDLKGNEAVQELKKCKQGFQLKIKIGSGDWRQIIFLGENRENTFLFFDGQGIDGKFEFSFRYLINNPESVKFRFNDNNPSEVIKLIGMIKNKQI